MVLEAEPHEGRCAPQQPCGKNAEIARVFQGIFASPAQKKRHVKAPSPPLFHQSRAERRNPLENQRNVPRTFSVGGCFYINLPSTRISSILALADPVSVAAAGAPSR
jgi:hypothetical protein